MSSAEQSRQKSARYRAKQARIQQAERQLKTLQELALLHKKTSPSHLSYANIKYMIAARIAEMDQRIKESKPFEELRTYSTWSPYAVKPTVDSLIEDAKSRPRSGAITSLVDRREHTPPDAKWSIANFMKQYEAGAEISVTNRQLVEHLPSPCSLCTTADVAALNRKLESQVPPWGNKFSNMICRGAYLLTPPNCETRIHQDYFLNWDLAYQVCGSKLWISWPANDHNCDWMLQKEAFKNTYSIEGAVLELTEMAVNVTKEGMTMLIPPGTMHASYSLDRSASIGFSFVPLPTVNTSEEVKKVVKNCIEKCKLREVEEGTVERNQIIGRFDEEIQDWERAYQGEFNLNNEQKQWLLEAIDAIKSHWLPFKSSLKKRKEIKEESKLDWDSEAK